MKKILLLLFIAVLFAGCRQQAGKDDAAARAPSAAALKTIEITVEGMTCTGCEQSIENALGSLEGVTAVEADHQAGLTKVTYDTVVTTRDGLEAAIEETGYKVIRE